MLFRMQEFLQLPYHIPACIFSGQFGSGVLTYFKFLKWLFQLNVVIFILMFVFVSIPQIAFANSSSSSIDPATISENTTNSLLIAIRCTDLYESNVTHSAIWWEEFIDLLQGTVSTIEESSRMEGDCCMEQRITLQQS